MGLIEMVEQVLHNSFVQETSSVYELLSESQRDEILAGSKLHNIKTSQPWYALDYKAKLDWAKWLMKLAFKTSNEKQNDEAVN